MSSADRDGGGPPATPAGGQGSPGVPSAFEVDEFTGTASLRLPLASSAPRELSPDLELAYGTDGRNGVAGFGFSTPAHSFGLYTGSGVPRYDGSDTFVFGGRPIVPLAEPARRITVGETSYTVTRYAPRTAPLQERIERWVREADGDVVWRQIDQGGLESLYGLDPSARIADPSHPWRVFEWLLQAQYDQRGEAIVYEYLPEDDAGLAAAPWEAGRDHAAQRYLGRVSYAPQTAVSPPPCGIGPVPEVEWHAEIVFDYGQYDADPTNPSPYEPTGAWKARPDPYSRYESGFEVRTHRLLRNVMLFHRFDALGEAPMLIHLTRLTHAESPVASTLVRFDSIGCADGECAPLPSLEFDWTPLELGREPFAPVTATGPGNLVGVSDPPFFSLADLAGEGADDILFTDGRSVLRRPAEAAEGAAFGRTEAVPEFPVERSVTGPAAQLADMTGSGLADLLIRVRGRAGIYPRDAEAGFERFAPFDGAATELADAAATFADLSDDGLPDLVTLAGERLRRYPGEGAAGFGAPEEIPTPAGSPAGLESAAAALTTFANLLGGGAQDLVRIRDGLVECWPSLGYGRFGARVVLGGAPVLGAEFDARRVLLADLDSSGVADLVYVGGTSALVYLNQSGNSFAPPVEVPLPTTVASPAQVTIADLRATGTQMLVVTEATPELRHWACPLTGPVRPYLLAGLRNGMGAETEIEYTTSARCRLEDRQAGIPWATLLPFPEQVVARIVQRDLIGDCSESTAYSYRHGYWSVPDREYGFAMVERRDTETVGGTNKLTPSPDRITRTWRLLGTLPDAALETALAAEWFAGDPEAKILPGPEIDWGGPAPSDGETVRQAYAALRGRTIRQEVYGSAGGEEAEIPYRVVQTAHQSCLVAPRGTGPYAAFATHERQSLDCVYERDAADPAVRHSLNLEIDPFGQVRRALAVAYPRRAGPDLRPEQDAALFVCNDFGYVDLDEEAVFRVGIPTERETSQLTGLPPAPPAEIYSLAEIEPLVAMAFGGEQGMAAIPVEAGRHLYYAADGVTPAPLGSCGPQALARTELRAAFADAAIRALFAGTVEGADLTDLLERGEYELDPAGGRWWGRRATATYLPASSFYRLAEAIEPTGAATTQRYDATFVALLETTETAAGVMTTNVTAERFDYAALVALAVEDANDSVTEVALDPLAQVVYSSFHGTELGKPIGFESITDPRPGPPSAEALVADPAAYLKEASVVSFYDLLSWTGRVTIADLEPLGLDSTKLLAALAAAGYLTPEGVILEAFRDLPGAAALILPEPFAAHSAAIYPLLAALPSGRPPHWVTVTATAWPGGEPQSPHLVVDYVDGFGRAIQHKEQASTAAKGGWVTSGAIRYDARGQVRARCDPFFTDSWDFTPEDLDEQLGTATIESYDPLGRPVRTDHPQGFFATVGIGAWSVTQADVIDTVLESRYWREHGDGQGIGPHELQALRQAVALAETPLVTELDPLGYAVAQVGLLKGAAGQRAEATATLRTSFGNDVLGRQLWSADPRLTASGAGHNFETTYALDGAALRVVSADAGEQLRLRTAAGAELFVRDGRGVRIETTHDQLRRPLAVNVREPGAEREPRAVEAWIYGDQLEDGAPIVPDPAGWNLVGEPYRIFDAAGMRQIDGYSLSREPMVTTQRYLVEAAARPDWTAAAAVPTSPLLAAETWGSTRTYDPLGRLIAMTDPVGSVYIWTYDRLGFPATIAMALPGGEPIDYVAAIDYNAQGQRTRVVLGNGAITRFAYEPLTHRLATATTTRGESGATVQELSYFYDPIGNVTYTEDAAFAKLFGEAVPPLQRAVTYDSLYRTATATGLEVGGYDPAGEIEPGYEGLTATPAGGTLPSGSVVAATRIHAYDTAGNLYWTERRAGESAWTTETVLSTASNRGVSAELLGLTPAPAGTVPPERTLSAGEIDRFFDADGNQTVVQRMPAITWDFADRIEAARVEVEGGEGSLLRAHDAVNALMRDVQTTPAAGGKQTLDSLYLDTLRVTRLTAAEGPAATSWTIEVRDGDLQVAEAVVEGESTRVAWSLTDPAGSVSVRLGADGGLLSYEAYTPYGATAFAVLPDPAEAADKRTRYDGEERDRLSGTYRFLRRDLAPWLGRWLSPDPTGPVDGLNLFAFVGDNPTSSTDIAGRMRIFFGGNFIRFGRTRMLGAYHDVGRAIKLHAKKEKLFQGLRRRKLAMVKVEKPGDFFKVAFHPEVHSEPEARKPVKAFAIKAGTLDVTMTKLPWEVGVYGTRTVKNLWRLKSGFPSYTDLTVTPGGDAIEAERLLEILGVKKLPTGTHPNDGIVPVIAISETSRSPFGGLLGMTALLGIKYGLFTFEQAFFGKKPIFIGAKKGGGAKALKNLNLIDLEDEDRDPDEKFMPKILVEHLESFVNHLHLHGTGVGTGSLFAGSKTGNDVKRRLSQYLLEHAGFPPELLDLLPKRKATRKRTTTGTVKAKTKPQTGRLAKTLLAAKAKVTEE